MKKYLLPLILIICLAFSLSVYSADLYGTYDQRIKLTIDNTKIDSDLTWFPVMIKLTSGQMEEVFAEFDSDDDFDRCAITLVDESTQIYGDCERFDDSESVAEYHVAKTGVITDADAAGYLYFYYDKDAAHNTTFISKSNGTAAQSVYDANFKAVYHMNDAPAFTAWTTQYEATVEPDSDGWTLGGTDYSSVSSGILTIDTTGDATGACYYYKAPDINFDAGVYYKIKVQMHTDTTATGYLLNWIYDGTQNERTILNIMDGKIQVRTAGGSYNDTIMDTISAYHIYEVYVKGTVVLVYVDGVLTDTQAVESVSVSDTIRFGDGSSTADANIECMIDYVYYALDVANNPAINNIIDSTSNANHGTKKGVDEPVEASGKVGQAQDFDGSDDYVDITSADFAFKDEDVTMEVITQITDNTDVYRSLLGIGDADGEPRLWLFKHRSGAVDGKITFQSYDAPTAIVASSILTGAELPLETAIYLAGVIDISEETIDLFYNGTSQDPQAITAFDLSDAGTDVGVLGIFHNKSSYPHNNWIDEVRVSNTARSAAWLKATYNSLFDTLLTYGDEETEPTGITWNGVTITKWNGITITKINGK